MNRCYKSKMIEIYDVNDPDNGIVGPHKGKWWSCKYRVRPTWSAWNLNVTVRDRKNMKAIMRSQSVTEGGMIDWPEEFAQRNEPEIVYQIFDFSVDDATIDWETPIANANVNNN